MNTTKKRSVSHTELRMWGLTAAALVLGSVLILVRAFGTADVGWHTAAEVLRDFGIALVVAALVTSIYEIHARERFATETLEQFLEKIIGDIVDTAVWREMHQQLLQKKAVRRQASVRLALKVHPGLPAPQAVLWTQMEYRLASLRSYPHKVMVNHFLDAFMQNKATALPRFLRIEVDGKIEQMKPGTLKFEKEVKLQGRDSPAVPIIVEREEVVYVPGAYNLIMSELTDLESISLLECPTNVEVVTNLLFDEQTLTTDRVLTPRRYLLPSQCLEVRFIPKPVSGTSMQPVPSV